MISKDRREYLLIRIAANSKPAANGCVEWTGTRTKAGYGLIHFAKEPGEGYQSCTTAHRAAYMAKHNVILGRYEQVLHKCDNPPCVNTNHLLRGTPKDNMQDMIAKGRKAKKHKLHTRQCKFTDEQILEIRNAPGMLREVAEKYEVSMSYVSKLRNGQAKTLVTPVSDLV